MLVQSGCSRKHRVPLFKDLAASIWCVCQLLNAKWNRSLLLQLSAVLIRIDEAPRAIGEATARVLQSDDLHHRHAVSRQPFGSKSQTTEFQLRNNAVKRWSCVTGKDPQFSIKDNEMCQWQNVPRT